MSLNVLFMGTPDFALEALKALFSAGYNVIAAVTQPDKPKGRGHKLSFPPVKEYAIEKGIPIFQPATLKNGELKDILSQYKPDIIVVAAYGKILPDYVIDYPKYGCINVHASLLPKYRGAAPIQHSILNGDEETGITIMQMDYGLDTGDILLIKGTPIGEYETSGALFDRLAVMGGELLIEALSMIESNTVIRTPQHSCGESYAHMIKKEMAHIDWNKPVRNISKLICAMNPWPLAYTEYDGLVMKIIEASVSDCKNAGVPGEIVGYEKGAGLQVRCADGVLNIKKLQFPGSKKMDIDDYMLGHSIDCGTVLS